MHSFRVWAPNAKSVVVQVDRQRYPMAAANHGWWTADVSAAAPDSRYGFILDGEGPFPDPRSQSQPDGVHGLSQLIDHARFSWTDSNFKAPPLAGALIYELHIGTFTPAGTFLAAIEKLDHLVSLGVTHVELMPIVEFDGNHGWGYDGVDLYAPHHAYGTSDDLKKFVDACHDRGLAALLDVVYNHLGPSGNYLGKYGPYFTKKFATFWGEGVNFDGPDSDEVRRFFCDNALMWLQDYHFDGLRLDAVHGILDTSAVHILEQLKNEVEVLSARIGRQFVLIPESDLNDPRLLWPRDRGGYGLDAQWSDDFHHALHTVLTGEKTGYYSDYGKMEQLAKAFRTAYVYDGQYSAHRRRVHGRPATGLNGRQFLGYLQNHDQVGNRAQGDRSSRLLNPRQLKMGAALVLASPFTPMLFQGEEWGAATPFCYFTDYQEPKLANAVREGRCREFEAFGWKASDTADPQARETLIHSVLDWREPARSPHSDILEWHKKLVELRRREPALADGRLDVIETTFSEDKAWLCVFRGPLAIVCNFSGKPQSIPLPAPEYRSLLASESDVEVANGAAHLPAQSIVICKNGD